MNKYIKEILLTLKNNGYEAYIVGGYVRDFLLGKNTYDVDICTNATPDRVINLFGGVKNNYGGVNFKVEDYNIDITTYRKELVYYKRSPKIEYCNSLEEDLKRRDFTINALCMDEYGHITDFYNGLSDLNERIIKCIGDIETKLNEDPLRILRAIRFATVLDFDIDKELLNGISNNKELVSTLSKTRVREELDKILASKNALKGLELLKDLGILDILHIEYNNIVYTDNLLGMWAQLKFFDIPFTNEEKKSIISITEIVNSKVIDNKILYQYGLNISLTAATILGINKDKVISIYNNLPIKDNKYIVSILKELGYENSDLGYMLKEITDKVLDNKLNSNKEDIIKYIMDRK